MIYDSIENRGRQTAAREHVLYLNGMRPAKEKAAALEHVNVALEYVNLSR